MSKKCSNPECGATKPSTEFYKRSLKKTTKFVDYIGCTPEELKAHLEKQFQKGMTWDNHTTNGWHVDHILPLTPEEPISEEEIYKRCHYTNLQPLWAKDNMRKNNRTIL